MTPMTHIGKRFPISFAAGLAIALAIAVGITVAGLPGAASATEEISPEDMIRLESTTRQGEQAGQQAAPAQKQMEDELMRKGAPDADSNDDDGGEGDSAY